MQYKHPEGTVGERYPTLMLYFDNMPMETKNKIAVAIKMVGLKEAARVYGLSETLCIHLFHPAFRNKPTVTLTLTRIYNKL